MSQWQRNTKNLLWNFNNMYQPCVVEVGGEHRYLMFFFGWAAAATNPGYPGCDAIFLARSNDLEHWEVYARHAGWDAAMTPATWVPVLTAGDRWYEAWHVGDPSVVLRDGRFYMAYSATSRHFEKVPGYPATIVQCVMGAVSDDGIHWTKSDRPLLIREGDSAEPKPEPDRIGDFHRPCLRWEDGRWRLWFDYGMPGRRQCVGCAENRGEFLAEGGFAFVHDLKEPILEDWPNPEMVRIGDVYHSFSDPGGYPGQTGWASRQLREAVSTDAIHWRKLDYIDPDPDTDACQVPQTLVTTIDGRHWLVLFYSCQVGNSRNDGKYHFEFDRIRAMRREIAD